MAGSPSSRATRSSCSSADQAVSRSVAAYDRHTGKRLWTALDDRTAYASPMQVTLLGVPQFLVVTASRLAGLSLDRRDVLWEFPEDRPRCERSPADRDWRQLSPSGYGAGAVVVELTKTGERFTTREVWRNIRMKNRQSSSVLHDGFIYGLDEGILACLDASTGAPGERADVGHGQLLLAGGSLFVTTEDGDLVLVAANPDSRQELAHVQILNDETWNEPALADGILLVRNTKEMVAIDLRPAAK